MKPASAPLDPARKGRGNGGTRQSRAGMRIVVISFGFDRMVHRRARNDGRRRP